MIRAALSYSGVPEECGPMSVHKAFKRVRVYCALLSGVATKLIPFDVCEKEEQPYAKNMRGELPNRVTASRLFIPCPRCVCRLPGESSCCSQMSWSNRRGSSEENRVVENGMKFRFHAIRYLFESIPVRTGVSMEGMRVLRGMKTTQPLTGMRTSASLMRLNRCV